MNIRARSRLATFLILSTWTGLAVAQPSGPDATLPDGVSTEWSLGRAWREATASRERVCVNGLWRWRPTDAATADKPSVPTDQWGYFKVPGSWPGITDYLQHDTQTVLAHDAWKGRKLGDVTAAWYQREIEIPQQWQGRRIALSLDYLNSFAAVYVDGTKIGEARFPAGEVDVTQACRPGQKHVLSLLVVAMPLKAVRLSYTDSAAAREVKGSVARRGLCGDVYLVSTPAGPRLEDVRVETFLRRSEVTFNASPRDLNASARYRLRARVTDDGRQIAEFTGQPFTATDVSGAGRVSFTAKWKPDRLWDIDTPQNQFDAQLTLVDAADTAKVIDTDFPRRFGYRELWIDGRDFYLNGTRLFLSALPLDNASMGAAWATYAGRRETFERLKSIGINCVYAHNYDCEPGAHLSFDEILRAADDAGVLFALTQPHFSAYDWKSPGADEKNGYARDAAFYARVAGSDPSVVFYSTSHNATGYDGDMDPDGIDGLRDPRTDNWSKNNAGQALRAEAILRRLDPTRIVYHHAGGNIGSIYTANFYPNFAPVQELSDWFGHWAKEGVKPLFLCEYGAPFTWDWTMYRGWYKGKREFGSAAVPWEFCLAEWNAQFFGDRAFQLQAEEKTNLRWEAKQFEAGKLWHRWDYPTSVGSARFEQRNEILATYLTDNLRAQRTWGVSGTSPWEYEIYWTPRSTADRGRKTLKTDWQNLQRPGFSPDYIDGKLERIDVAFDREDWAPTAAGKALLRNNQPVLAYIGGKAEAFSSKDHNFRPGDVVEKQLILINGSRRKVTLKCGWSLALPNAIDGMREVTLGPGQQERVPLKFDLPAGLLPGRYELRASARFAGDDGAAQEQADSFAINVLPAPKPAEAPSKIALFDPHTETGELLRKLGIAVQKVDAAADLSGYETLIIGKHALTVDGPAPDLSRVRQGLKVIIFEQTSIALERRLGFRVVEYGLRQAFTRIPGHPLLDGVTVEQLHDWRGEATTVAPRINYESVPQHGPTTLWSGIPCSRVWRCGNRGNVASVLIEKPARGDFRPIVDGGFSLQYAPMMEYREGRGLILFCQLDVTGRTEADAAADTIVRNLFHYAATWKPQPSRRAVYAGDDAGREHLKSCSIDAASIDAGALSPTEHVLVVGPGARQQLATHKPAIEAFLKDGGRLLAIGIDQRDANALLPQRVTFKRAEHIAASFDPPALQSPLAGVGPADVHNRGPREMPLVAGGATIVGDGVLGANASGSVVFWQLPPWQLDYHRSYSLKRTYRRAAFTTTRLLANLGVAGQTPLLGRFVAPAEAKGSDKRWADGLYLDAPEEWDDPYRFFRW